MMTMAEKKVREQLDRVFTQNGEVKACGRAECRKAIQAASEFYPGVDFGNIETGIMNLQAFQDYFFSDKALRKQLLEVFTTQGVLLSLEDRRVVDLAPDHPPEVAENIRQRCFVLRI